MPSKADDILSVPFQKSVISGNLNSSLLLLFLSGVSCLWTVYIAINISL